MNMIGSLESTTVRVSPARRRGRRNNDLICYINVTGVAAILFTLLIAFMVGPADFPHHGYPVDMAKVSHPKPMRHADAEDALTVGIRRDGRIFFGTEKIHIEQLPSGIRASLDRGAENRVYIRADPRARYGTVKEVLDAVHDAGVENVAFIVSPPR